MDEMLLKMAKILIYAILIDALQRRNEPSDTKEWPSGKDFVEYLNSIGLLDKLTEHRIPYYAPV